ncbi:hypothetical protein CQ14_40195 [Bradyrhizobium lablabi]|uniref:Uncharacterized protein n=1 Tax=Bradyrhizobium lablabi TaxID=722472 RepID=A0A0R3MD71_9BRAD|nr:hypothetical protein [Bradyrhizobium lablabi]KRR18290.1 hypothetical protein CQ14_40195 [Bradyrhizobium lablabi]
MPCKAFMTAYELEDMIVEQASSLRGPWPERMTLFVFDDAYGWSASVSRPEFDDDLRYRATALNIVTQL